MDSRRQLERLNDQLRLQLRLSERRHARLRRAHAGRKAQVRLYVAQLRQLTAQFEKLSSFTRSLREYVSHAASDRADGADGD